MKKKSLLTILILALVLAVALAACTPATVGVTGVTLNKTTLSLVRGTDETLVATVAPADAENKTVTWSSSNTAVATVNSSGKVTAVKVGTTTITVTTEDGGKTATCEVTVVSPDTLVVGYSEFSSKFSPFFSKTAYDADVAAMTQLSLLTTDRLGNIIYNAIEGETTTYMGTEYLYTGIANIDVTIGATETVYAIEIRDDLVFSDGVPVTIDDVIFSMYVISDPTYTGSSTLYAAKILGMEDYRTNGTGSLARAFMAEANELVYQYALYYNGIDAENTLTPSEMEVIDWLIEKIQLTNAFGWTQDYLDYLIDWYGGENIDEALENAAIDELFAFKNLTPDDEGFYSLWWYGDYEDDLTSIKGSELAAQVGEEDIVKTISGIVKTGAYSMTVTTEGFEASTIYQLGLQVAPLHYYGDVAKYNYDESKFGFDKGDLTGVDAKTTTPMGAGAYKFVEYTNNIVYFERNTLYYKGSPNIKYIQFRETTDADKISGIIAGTFDVTDPSINEAAVAQIQGANSNGQLSGNVIQTNLVDNLGYGYIGLNASRVNVGGISDSEASKNLRKAYATIFAVYRDVVTDSYYGERATVIQYPISNTSWAAPQPTDDGYQIAFSRDVNGNPIYTAGMNEQAKYAAALEAAKGFFIAAGFTWDAAQSKFTDVPARIFHIPADGIGDHPAFAMVTMSQAALETIGIDLDINDVGGTAFWNLLESNSCDFWAAAWGATIDPDMYQVYYSTNIIGAGGTDSNHYHITDSDLDELILLARQSADQSYRRAMYKECLDIIADWAVEVPTYQRKNAVIFSNVRIDMSTITPDITTFWGWMNDIELIE